MKFKCGYTRDERLAREAARRAEQKRIEDWHRIFAIMPHQVAEGDCRWLEYIERKLIWEEGCYSSESRWIYRAIA